jgi:putative NIF3 family GTP cyclohydrolase 1 type 2
LRRVLLDEDLPHKLRPPLSEFDVWTVARMGWAGIKNGTLLKQAQEESFDVFVTGDKNISHQQNLNRLTLGIVLLDTPSTQFRDIQP